MPQNYKKRRAPQGPSKNELRAARHAQSERSGGVTLLQRFPTVEQVDLDYRIESNTGIPLDHIIKHFGAQDPLKLEILCPSTCGNGRFDISEMFNTVVQQTKEIHEGMGICQTPSYMDPRVVCGTKLYYRLTIKYKGETA